MLLTQEQALLWTGRLIALALALQSLELLKLRPLYSERGIWRWSTLRNEFPSPWRQLLSSLLRARRFELVLCIQFFAALSALALPSAVIFWILLGTATLVLLRWRGTFNGGSDFMTLVVLMGTTVAWTFSGHPLVRAGALWYIAIQCVLSYFISGVIKLRRANWRSGVALQGFLKFSVHEPSSTLRIFTSSRELSMLACWAVMLIEVSFPLALLSPALAVTYAALGLAFHLATFHAFGLNRFVFAWMASYPALIFCSLIRL